MVKSNVRFIGFVLLMVSILFSNTLFASPSRSKLWTFMVFINADNNLDNFGVKDMNEMAKVGSNDYMNIVVLIDREKGPATLNYIEKGKIKLLKEMGELDMGDYKVLVNFVKEVVSQYPAKHYALVVWNHGSGWKFKKEPITKGISYDDQSGNHITTAQLSIAFEEIKTFLGRNLDVLGFDACLMQMAEVAYAVNKRVDYLVGSEETEPGDGWPYDLILSTVDTKTTPIDLAKNIVAKYAASYSGGSQGSQNSTQSALNMNYIDEFVDGINGLSKAIIASNYSAQIKDALNKVQKFYYRTNIDLLDFIQLLSKSINDESFKTACEKLQFILNNFIVANATSGYSTKNAKGLAIYFPASSYSYSNAYNDLAFAQDTMWDDMVLDFYKKATTTQITSDLQRGDLTSLQNFVANSSKNIKLLNKQIYDALNFMIYTEGSINKELVPEVQKLMNNLKN